MCIARCLRSGAKRADGAGQITQPPRTAAKSFHHQGVHEMASLQVPCCTWWIRPHWSQVLRTRLQPVRRSTSRALRCRVLAGQWRARSSDALRAATGNPRPAVAAAAAAARRGRSRRLRGTDCVRGAGACVPPTGARHKRTAAHGRSHLILCDAAAHCFTGRPRPRSRMIPRHAQLLTRLWHAGGIRSAHAASTVGYALRTGWSLPGRESTGATRPGSGAPPVVACYWLHSLSVRTDAGLRTASWRPPAAVALLAGAALVAAPGAAADATQQEVRVQHAAVGPGRRGSLHTTSRGAAVAAGRRDRHHMRPPARRPPAAARMPLRTPSLQSQLRRHDALCGTMHPSPALSRTRAPPPPAQPPTPPPTVF